jgi:hypothetical protein
MCRLHRPLSCHRSSDAMWFVIRFTLWPTLVHAVMQHLQKNWAILVWNKWENTEIIQNTVLEFVCCNWRTPHPPKYLYGVWQIYSILLINHLGATACYRYHRKFGLEAINWCARIVGLASSISISLHEGEFQFDEDFGLDTIPSDNKQPHSHRGIRSSFPKRVPHDIASKPAFFLHTKTHWMWLVCWH